MKLQVINEPTRRYYLVENGEVFFGDTSQWANVFFSNVTDDNVANYCLQEGWKLEMLMLAESEISDFVDRRGILCLQRSAI